LDQLIFILKILFSFFTKQATLRRRSTVLGLSPQLAFPGLSRGIYHRRSSKLFALKIGAKTFARMSKSLVGSASVPRQSDKRQSTQMAIGKMVAGVNTELPRLGYP